MADSLLVEEAAMQAQAECVEENKLLAFDNQTDDNAPERKQGFTVEKKKTLKNTKKGKRQNSGGVRGGQKEGVLYIGHLGNDFLEPELSKFLGQFGRVRALRVSRSKRTGNPKGYAFCQMESRDIASIVADTLSGYILFGKRRLVCHVVPPEKVHRNLFFQFVYKPKGLSRKELDEFNDQALHNSQKKSLHKIKVVTEKLVERERKKRKVLEELGIDYDFPGYEGALTAENENAEPIKKARTVSDVDIGSNTVKSKFTASDGDHAPRETLTTKVTEDTKETEGTVETPSFSEASEAIKMKKDNIEKEKAEVVENEEVSTAATPTTTLTTTSTRLLSSIPSEKKHKKKKEGKSKKKSKK